ncbi:syntaxin-like protein psy1 [Xylariaceae sp. FL1272]|nr:syntaxin-like protein psy1 [Xylariaceae sp. FL1272]
MNTNTMSYNSQPYSNQPYGNQPYDSQPYNGQPYPDAEQGIPMQSMVLGQSQFFAEISGLESKIENLNENVKQLESLNRQYSSEVESTRIRRERDYIISQTTAEHATIRDAIQNLTNDWGRTPEGNNKNIKNTQIKKIKGNFQNELHRYQAVQGQFDSLVRDEIKRQYLIVDPNATQQDVQEAADRMAAGDEGVFQTALRTSRTGQASTVLGNVRARHNVLQEIHDQIVEVARMMEYLDTMVVQQDATIQKVEEQTENVNQNLIQGNDYVGKGITSARNRRKLKWWCLLVTILIIAIAIGLGVGITMAQQKAAGN